MNQPIVLHLVASTGLYGAETVILNLSKQMAHSPFSSVIGMICENGHETQEIGIAAQELGLETVSFLSEGRFDPMCCKRINEYLKKHNDVIVHSHGYKASILSYLPCKLQKSPLIITCHLWFNAGDTKLQLYHKMETIIMKRAPAVAGVSDVICNELISAGINEDKVHCVYNGIDVSNYRQFPTEKTKILFSNMNITKHDFVVGAIGRLHEQKDFHVLIQAIKQLYEKKVNVKCVIFGDGPLLKDLEKQRDKLGLRGIVHLPGFRQDILNLLEMMDVFVISSIDEGLPMVLLEAMAKKKAIISTPVGAIATVLTHNKDALLFDVGDVKTLTNHIGYLKINRNKREELAKAALKRFQTEYTAKVMANKYERLYYNLLN